MTNNIKAVTLDQDHYYTSLYELIIRNGYYQILVLVAEDDERPLVTELMDLNIAITTGEINNMRQYHVSSHLRLRERGETNNVVVSMRLNSEDVTIDDLTDEDIRFLKEITVHQLISNIHPSTSEQKEYRILTSYAVGPELPPFTTEQHTISLG